MRAARGGHLDCLRVLLSHNIDVNTQDGKGQTMLHIAVEGNKPECIDLLIEQKAKSDLKDKSGNSPIDIAKTTARWKAGTAVRVRSGVTPKYGWGSASAGDVGRVMYQLGSLVFVDFPKLSDAWRGHEPDLEQCAQSLLQTQSTRTTGGSPGGSDELARLIALGLLLNASQPSLGTCDNNNCNVRFTSESQRHQCCKCQEYYCYNHIKQAVETRPGLFGLIVRQSIEICPACLLLHQLVQLSSS